MNSFETFKYVKITASLVNGGTLEFDHLNCKGIIESLVSDDIRPPIKYLLINAKTRDGKPVTILIPNNENDEIFIDDVE
jgi:hypothetical protein